jgi:hypothetical protein
MRNRSSCAAILAVVRRVHRKPLMGSPFFSPASGGAAAVYTFPHRLQRSFSNSYTVAAKGVQFNNKVDVCGGLYPVDLAELVRNHFTWVFEPFRQQRMKGKTEGDEALVTLTIRRVCDRLEDLLKGTAGTAPITAEPEILYESPFGFVVADEKGDPNSRLVLAARRYTNLISLVCERSNGRYTYSVIRGSPYDEDTFQVIKLIHAFQAAEDLPTAKIWGGSNLAAGSDSELGSSLHWTRIRDIAEAIVEVHEPERTRYS